MKLHLLIYVVLLGHSLCSSDQQNLTSVVQTDKGPVQGEIRTTVWNSVPYSSFRGIPYGKPPVGYARFKPPQEAEPWHETFQATSEATPCPQMDFVYDQNYVGDEDCLNLNVYTPKTNFSGRDRDEKLKPVMVWIYGGSFKDGYTNITLYGPDFLIEDGVVVVAMNYRMGVLGFLALDVANATGNAGLKDQLLALKWVQRNIKNFGGDPNSVTIFGESAGAVSVDYHVLSHKSRGLFHRALSMSGSPLCVWGFTTRAQADFNAFWVGNILDVHTFNKTTLLKALYNRSAEAIVRATLKMTLIDPPFKPTLEDPKTAGDNAFLTNCALNKYKSKNFTDVPYLTGFMANESLSFIVAPSTAIETLQLARDILEVINSPALASVSPFLKNLTYAEANGPGQVTMEAVKAGIKISTDLLFIAGIDQQQRLLTKYGSQPVYYYRNSFAPNDSLHALFDGINIIGAGHADDLAYCWHISIKEWPTNLDHSFVITQKRVTRMWTNFAKYSNPTPNGTDDKLLNVVWPVSGAEGKHLEINRNLSVGPRPIDILTDNFERDSEPLLAFISGCDAIKVI